jgi:Family of unknown function (DUF6516)
MAADSGLTTLLDLHGEILDQGNGYWVEIRAWAVEVTRDVPHALRYSLTLHDRHGTRIMGFDNAHAPKMPGKFRYAGQRLPYDHRHRHASDEGVPYSFKNAHQLLSDFFEEVDRVLKILSEKQS